MDAERYQRLKWLLFEASRRTDEERRAWLDEACAGDVELRREVESLLAAHAVRTTDAFAPLAGAARLERLPERVGPYRLGEELGRGGMGVVHAAIDERTGRAVAVKIVHPHLLQDERSARRFEREAELGRAVEHENVVRTLDVGTEDVGESRIHFLVMERVQGRTLRRLLEELGVVPEGLLRELARQACDGLAAIHERGIVHRDVKPENILLTPDERVRLMDLGVARLVDASVSLTREGQFVGTLSHAAPEQLEGHAPSAAGDLYSLGVVLHELATGTNPFWRDNPAATIRAHLDGSPPPVRESRPEMSPFLEALIATLHARRPEERPDSARAVSRILEQGERGAWWQQRRDRTAAEPTRVPVRRLTGVHGREAELTRLRAAWARARSGAGVVVLVSGEAGIGKSRLIDELLGGISREGAHVLYGSSPPGGGLRGLSEALTGRFGTRDLSGALAPYLPDSPELARLLAALALRASPPEGIAPLAPDALPHACGRLLAGLAEDRPTAWVVEDLHFAPKEGWALALGLARAALGRRAMVLLTTRTSEPSEERALLARLDGFQELVLGRLDPEEISDLVREALNDSDVADRLAPRIAAKSDGVPLFVLEMLRGLEEAGVLRRDPAGRWTIEGDPTSVEVPSAVRDLVALRLRELERSEREVLDVGAVQGDELEAAIIAEVLERPVVSVLRDLAEVERRHGLVHSSGARHVFDHHLVHEVLLAELPPALEREFHLRVAEAHERRLTAAPTGREAFRLAFHHLRGSRPERARSLLTSALDHLAGRYLHEAALDLADRALEPGVLDDASTRADVLLRSASTAEILGRRELQRERCQSALDLACGIGDPALEARARTALGSLLWRIAEEPSAVAELERARELSRRTGDRGLEARATGHLATALMRMGRHEEGIELHEWCRRIAVDVGDRRAEALAIGNLGVILFERSRYEEAREHYERAGALARELGDPRLESHAEGGLGLSCWHLGLHGEALAHHRRQLELGRSVGDRRTEGIAIGNCGLVLADMGRLDEALRHLRQNTEIDGEVGDRRGVAVSMANTAATLLMLGDVEEAREMLDESLARAIELGFDRLQAHVRLRLARADSTEGATTEALEHVRHAVRIFESIPDPDSTAEARIQEARLAILDGRNEEAAARLDEAIRLTADVAGPANRVLALALRATLPGGDAEAAASMLAEHDAKLSVGVRMEARMALWRATSERRHLEEARAMLEHVRRHAPESSRSRMVERVPLHREISRAHGEREEHGEPPAS